MKDAIQRYLQVEAKEADGGTVTVIASAPTEDRMDDIVEAPWKLYRFMANPVIQWAHRYDIPPVGRATSVTVEDGVLLATIEFDESEENPLGRTVASQMRRGFLNAVSVGFNPGEAIDRRSFADDDPRHNDRGYVFRGNELLEISVVPIPANPEALALRSAVSSMDPRPATERAREMLADSEIRAAAEAILLAAPAKSAPDAMLDLLGPDPLSSVFGHCDQDDTQP